MTGGWPDLERFFYDLSFAEIAETESKRTLVVQLVDEPRVRAMLAELDPNERITLVVSAWIPDGTWYVIDQQAIEAGQEAAMQLMQRKPLFPPGVLQ